MAFKNRRAPGHPGKSEEEFLAEAEAGPKATSEPEGGLPKAPPAKAKADPLAPPCKAFNLRLNDHQVELLRRAAKESRRSMQQQALAILLAGLEPK